MIARFKVLLPFSIYVPEGATLEPLAFQHGAYEVVVHPPTQTAEVCTATYAVPRVLGGDPAIAITNEIGDAVQMNKRRTLAANVLQIDFKSSEFRREPWVSSQDLDTDPPLGTCFLVANGVIARMRTVAQASHLNTVCDPKAFRWSIEYLNDDLTQLEHDPQRFRKTGTTPLSVQVCGITEGMWQQVAALPNLYEELIYGRLLLDAYAALNAMDFGVATVLAYTTLETLIEYVFERLLPRSAMDSDLWKWIKERDNYWKEPSIAEKYDVLLKALSGATLKSDVALWQGFQEIRDARNSFVHEGKLLVGQRLATKDDVQRFVESARKITEFVEEVLLASERRPRTRETTEYSVRLFERRPTETVK